MLSRNEIEMKRIMEFSVLSSILIALGVVLLVLGSIPMKNTLEGDTLTVHFIIGKKNIDVKDAKFLPVPEDATHHIIRVAGTSVGSKRSGKFMNTQTRTRYFFYLTGKGQKTYFEIGDKKYLVDGLS